MTTIKSSDVQRYARTILLGQNRTATEGHDGLPTLIIRDHGRQIKDYRGSSLDFGNPLSAADREYIASLGSD
jgi:hypothetical protein